MEKKDNSGALFKVEEVKSDKHPVYTGVAMIDGKEKNISAWINTAKTSGKQYMSLKFYVHKPKVDKYYTSTATPVPEDEVPF